MTTIDSNKLAAHVAREQAKRTPRIGSKAMAIIRDNMMTIEVLRGQGHTWDAIAAGFAAQGVAHRDGHPLTGKRLTSLIDSIRRQDAKRQAKRDKRLTRADLARAPPQPGQPRLRLAAELLAPTEPSEGGTPSETEKAIRRQQYEATKSLFKKKE